MQHPKIQNVTCHPIETPDGELYFTGPPLDQGPLPALLYFSISGEESLTLDPFNQPVAFLQEKNIRCYSITLPYHGEGFDKAEAMHLWVREISKGKDILTPFLDLAERQINYLIDQNLIDIDHFAIAGLSRGSFIACHLAARIASIKTILGYAPLTTLNALQGSISHSLLEQYSLWNLFDSLYKKTIRFYIGNLDFRVGTDHCFHFINSLSLHALEQKIRSPKIELIISPSVGHKGHGTSPQTFFDGTIWLSDQLSLNSNPSQSHE